MIRYEFEQPPSAGVTVPVASGIRWLRMPLPFSLSHINLWLLDDEAGVTIVDTGLTGSPTRELWHGLFAAETGSRLPTRLIVTHMHPDHVGSAGWLCDEYGLELWMTRSEYLMCRMLSADTGPAPAKAVTFYRQAGFDEAALQTYTERFGGFGRAVDPLPVSFHRLRDGEQIRIGTMDWEIVCGYGHSPEHACLYSRATQVLVAGDQLLPTISSNVSVWPTEPCANPLDEWLASCRRLREFLPHDVLVLPAHGKPFRGAHERLTALITEHEQGLAKLEAMCRERRRAVDVFPALFKSRISDGNLMMATGEAIAHLNYLIGEGLVAVEEDDDGVNWYRSVR